MIVAVAVKVCSFVLIIDVVPLIVYFILFGFVFVCQINVYVKFLFSFKVEDMELFFSMSSFSPVE